MTGAFVSIFARVRFCAGLFLSRVTRVQLPGEILMQLPEEIAIMLYTIVSLYI